MTKKWFVFDFDGTIADTWPQLLQIVNKLALKYKLRTLTEKEFREARNKPIFKLVREYQIPLLKIPFMINEGRQMLRQDIGKIKLKKGIKRVILELKNKGKQLGILTSNLKDSVEEFLWANQLEVFDFVTSEANIFGKHRALQSLIKRLKIDKSELVYIGDEVRDIQAARAAGVDILAVTWGLNSKKLLQSAQPDFLVDKPEELLELFKN